MMEGKYVPLDSEGPAECPSTGTGGGTGDVVQPTCTPRRIRLIKVLVLVIIGVIGFFAFVGCDGHSQMKRYHHHHGHHHDNLRHSNVPFDSDEMTPPAPVLHKPPTVSPLCLSYFDGCNTCSRINHNMQFSCTEMACIPEMSLPRPRCTKYVKKKPYHQKQHTPPENCQNWFDGCNHCHRGVPGGAMACTMMFCANDMRKPSKCEKYFPPTEAKAEPPAKCEKWFDGCKVCYKSAPGKHFTACTPSVCSHGMKKQGRCMKYFSKSSGSVLAKFPVAVTQKLEPPIDCKNWFDGCNSCHRKEPAGNFACTKRFCHAGMLRPAKCRAHFENFAVDPVPLIEEHPVKEEAPVDCKSWFDGCNSCHRSKRGGPLACTRMYCPPEMLKPTKCKEYFPPDEELVRVRTPQPTLQPTP